VVVTEADVDAEIDEQAAILGTSQAEMQGVLENSGVSWEEFRTAIREEIALRKFIEEVIAERIEITDSQVQTYYQENIEQYTAGPGERHIRHILVETEEEAQAVYDQAIAGEDFALLAEVNSIGPTAPDGGSLGFVSEDTPLVEPFLVAALELDVEEVSEPVQTQFGWHVIYRDTDVISLREARVEISELLAQDATRNEFEAALAEQRGMAEIQRFITVTDDMFMQPANAAQ
jgi:parvulin-like peptidyl-prolyl isomerase